MGNRRAFLVTVSFIMLVSLGCRHSYKDQMENVAKKWCMTIHASQVIPVYPLEQGIRPGDIYLVGEAHAIQKDIYEQKGFLPLDTYYHRLERAEEKLKEYYGMDVLSEVWSTTELNEGEQSASALALKECAPKTDDYERLLCLVDKISKTKSVKPRNLPLAVFPSYTADVGMDGSLGLGISLEGIPIGLSMLHSSKATAVVSIKDAYNIGLPVSVLYPDAQAWAARPETRSALRMYAGAHEKTLYIRLINKVFLAQRFDIALLDTSKKGAALEAGKDREKDQDSPPEPNMNTQLAEIAMQNLMMVASGQAAGGEVSLTSKSSLGVSLRETLPRPVVIGYHSVDIPIFQGGYLGAPVATQSFLLSEATPVTFEGQIDAELALINEIRESFNEMDDACSRRFIQRVTEVDPMTYAEVATALQFFDSEGKPVAVDASNMDAVKMSRKAIMGDENIHLTMEKLKERFNRITDDRVFEVATQSAENAFAVLSSLRATHVSAMNDVRVECE